STEQHIGTSVHLAAGFASESDREQTARACGVESVEDAWRIAAGGDSNSNVAILAESFDLTREYLLVAVIVAESCENGCVCRERNSRQRGAIRPEASHQLGGQMLRVGGAAAISKEQNLVPALEHLRELRSGFDDA